jgi:hypothetical protein
MKPNLPLPSIKLLTADKSWSGRDGDALPARSAAAPESDDVARSAYFSYIAQGSQPGHDLRHWLEAEERLREMGRVTAANGYGEQAWEMPRQEVGAALASERRG